MADWPEVRLRRRKQRVGARDASAARPGEAARLPDYMLDFESWRRHRAERERTQEAEKTRGSDARV
jgi:hypothetical protein